MNLAELEALLGGATPGPWKEGNGAVWSDCNGEGNSPACVCEYSSEKDTTLIAALRNQVPALIARIRELENSPPPTN